MSTGPTDQEVRRLSAFRRAARQVREASIIANAQSIEVRGVPGEAGSVDVYVQLLGGEAFRSLALSIRLAYQQGEPSQFLSVCGVLSKHWPEVRDRVGLLRSQFLGALRDNGNRVTLLDGGEPASYTAQEVFETWLYGVAFHQDPAREEAVARLEAEGAMFLWSVQSTSLQLAGRIMDLDDVIAEVSGQKRLPRI